MIDPQERWAQYGEKPDYAGLLTFAGAPYTEDPGGARGLRRRDRRRADGRPRLRPPGRAPRAARDPRRRARRPGPHLEVKVDAFAELRVVDFGDAPVIPADPVTSHAAIEATVGQVLAAGVMPVVLGGDHSITEPSRARVRGRRTGRSGSSTSTPTPTPARRCSASSSRTARSSAASSTQGHVDGSRYAQIGLRGYWPGEEEFGWQAERGITSLFMHDVRDLGIREVVAARDRGGRARARPT